jgi:hypothetical protein
MDFIKKLKAHKREFQGVALATLLSGAGILALGLVELGFNMWGDGSFTSPMMKVIGGLIVLSLGYIHLELELIRTK